VREAIYTDVLYYLLKRVFNMRIAVCDDEQSFRIIVKNAVYGYSNEHRLDIAIDEFACGEDLLKVALKYDIIFMDYKMDGIDGLETARILRKENINCIIIFFTSYPHFVYESFEVSTFRFFEKPLDNDKLYKALDDYFELFGNNSPLLLKEDRGVICIHMNDIVYLEADNKKCFIHIAGKKPLHCAKTMAVVASKIPNNIFYRVSKAFIVNFNYISGYNNEYIFFKNGERVHVSRKYLTPFKDAYRSFAKGRVV